MATKKKTGVQITTPRGVAVYPKLNAPDYKYKKEGKYTAKLRLDLSNPEVQAFKARLIEMRDTYLAAEIERLKGEKKAALAMELKPAEVLKPERDPETGEELGTTTLSASMNAAGTREDGSTWSQKPAIFDAKGTELKNPPLIYGGTELKLSANFEAYTDNKTKEVGIGIRLLGAQILKLVSGGQRDFSGLGFQAEDGDEIEDRPVFANESGDTQDAGGNDDL